MPDRRALTIYGASDHAVTSEGGDYTVHVVVGIDLHGRMFLLDLWRQQASPDKWIEAFCNLVEQWRPVGWAEETGQIRSGIGPFLVKRLRERRLYVVRAQFPTRGDKAVRAQSIRGRMEMDGLYVPTHAPWYPELRRELLAFPAGKYDDQVDALGLIGQVLDKMVSGRPLPRPAEAPKLLSTDPKLCTVTLDDLFTANEQRGKHRVERIH
jgi:predicted phage terminase large subunit-like protein